MGPFEMVVAITLIAAVGKFAQSLVSRPRSTDEPAARQRLERLESQLQGTEARLTHSEERVADLAEKLEFMENLLASSAASPRLGSAGEERAP
jgi:hypothetical protein